MWSPMASYMPAYVYTPMPIYMPILYTCYGYTMGMGGLPDMYTRGPRAAGPRDEGVHIRQTTNAHAINVMCHTTPPLVSWR